MKRYLFYFCFLSALASSCGGEHKSDVPKLQEDAKAKQLLQGIWLNDEAGDVAFKVKGDTIYYPDTTSMPVSFQIFSDTLVLHGAKSTKYPIVKQSAHIFVFANQNGDQVKLIKSEDDADDYFFEGMKVRPLNQNKLIKRDTIVVYGEDKYHCYVQVNPTTFKVVTSSYNDEGVAVDNIYHDNIIHLSIFKGAAKVFSSDFRKQDFRHYVSKNILDEAILSDLLFNKIDKNGIIYTAVLGIGDSNMSYEVSVIIGFDGKIRIKEEK